MVLIPKNELKRATLPPELIIDNYIENYRDTSYEEYLTEYINCSSLFMSISEGEPYQHIPQKRQNQGECDCCSSRYELDFKLFGTQSSIYAKRNLSFQKYMAAEGIMLSCIPRQSRGMHIAIMNGLLQRYDLNDLLAIDQERHSKFDRDDLSVETEIQSILKVMKCKKNTLYFSADFLFVDNNYAISDILHTVEGWLNDCFSQLFMFREQFVPDKDTYFAIIIEGYLCIAVWNKQSLIFHDYIPLSQSNSFCEVYDMIEDRYKRYLVLR